MMRRALLFLVVAVVIVAAAWGLAHLSGRVSVSVGAITIETSIALAILAAVIVFIIGLLIVRLLTATAGLPAYSVTLRRRQRLRLGNRAVTRVLVALAAGEQVAARKEARRAKQLLGASPQTLLLVAEASRLSGREDEAEDAFRALTRQDEAKFLGYRGLLRQAIDRRDWTKAEAIAREAEAAYPGTRWLRQQRALLAIQTDNWAEAADLSDPGHERSAYFVAASDAEPNDSRALKLAVQAQKEDPNFQPAILAYARRQRALGRENRAQSAIADGWKRDPHPDLAEFALQGQAPGLERFQAAKRLVANNPSHPESRLLLGRAAIDAGLVGEARHQTEAARAEGINQRRLWLLIADIEERERGDTEEGRQAQRDALRRAAAADPDPAWRCVNCRTGHASWSPRCSSCGSVGTLRWQEVPQVASLPAIA